MTVFGNIYDFIKTDGIAKSLIYHQGGIEKQVIGSSEKPVYAPDEPFDIAEEEPGYDPVTGEMVIYRPWGNFTIFYGDFRYSDELVPHGKEESGLELLSEKTEDFSGTLELVE